jgi:drug/metabolite transporter (DMT)-like permease
VTAIALALAASACWGVGDFLGGVTSRRISALAVLAVSEAAGLAVIAAVAMLLGEGAPGGDALALAAAAGLGGVVGLGGLYRGMAVGAMAVVAPISAAAAVVPLVYGLATGERPSPLQLVGSGAVLLGVAAASRDPAVAGVRVARGVGLALVAALGFGWYFVLIDAASDADVVWAVLVSRGVATVVAVAAAASVGRLRVPRAQLPVVGVIGVFDVGANGLLATALTKGYVSIVSVVASLYPVVTVALAVSVLRERPARVQTVGIAVALAGVALIATG